MILTGYSLCNFGRYNSDNKGITDESMRTYENNKVRGLRLWVSWWWLWKYFTSSKIILSKEYSSDILYI